MGTQPNYIIILPETLPQRVSTSGIVRPPGGPAVHLWGGAPLRGVFVLDKFHFLEIPPRFEEVEEGRRGGGAEPLSADWLMETNCCRCLCCTAS